MINNSEDNINKKMDFLSEKLDEVTKIVGDSLEILVSPEFKEFRMFIAEKIFEMSDILDRKLEYIYENSMDEDLLYWISHLLLERKNFIGVEKLLEVVRSDNHPSDSAFTALKLSKMKVNEVYPLVIKKLREYEGNQPYYVITLLDSIKILNFDIPGDIITKFTQPHVPWQIKETIKDNIPN